ncbi:MAG: sodium/proton-translocating pyrophosphatase [Elusimicrobia bacterium]|nr:sodium/proton-translocating pyrophosphatase [Elusimicrobiota bacterium]
MVLIITLLISLLSLGFAAWLAWYVFKKDIGTPEMQAAADALQKGVMALLNRQLAVLGALSAATAVLIYAALVLFTARGHIPAVQTAVSFLSGAFSAALAGFIVTQISWLCAVRTAAEAKRSVSQALTIALRGGAAGSIAAFAVCLAAMGALFFLMRGLAEAQAAPLKMAGFCLGAAFSAMFAQLGGGIYAAAAGSNGAFAAANEPETPAPPSFGGELVGRNDACWRLGADLFCSASAQSAAAMILGAGLWPVFGARGVLFALAARAAGLIASIAGVISARASEGAKPMSVLNKGYAVASAVSVAGLGLAVFFLLAGNMWLFMAGVIGIVTHGLLIFITYYYNGYKYRPVKHIAESSKAGPAAVCLSGISAAMEGAAAPVIVIAAALLGAYYCGIRGLEAYMALGAVRPMLCGFYGTAVAASGMLAVEAYMAAVGSLDSIAGNAGAIARMTRQSEDTRKNTAALQDLGDTTRALAGGHALGAATLAGILMFAAYMDSVKVFTGLPFESVNMAKVEVFIGGLMGAVLVFLFGGLAIRAVLKASAERAINHVGFMAGHVPCVVHGALKNMAVPGLLAAGMPVVTGLIFKQFGLGAEALAAFLLVCAICGILAGAVVDNCAGAWNNAGKSMERGNFDGMDSSAHQAVLACSAAGNTLKDASFGPALYALVKLAAAAALVLAPLFI